MSMTILQQSLQNSSILKKLTQNHRQHFSQNSTRSSFYYYYYHLPFLNSLLSLLERPENHHMIRWDAAGEHIIVERPEQLALHVLPSIYRQSRFASFSRQLNVKHPSTSLDRSILSLKVSFFLDLRFHAKGQPA